MHRDTDTTDDGDLTHAHLLLHYVDGSQRTIESVDQLGNFLMGFGVLALGYLLNADLGPTLGAWRSGGGEVQHVAGATLVAWALAVLFLVVFSLIYVFQVLPGRSVHARDDKPDAIGAVLAGRVPTNFREFMRDQRTFSEFLQTSYLPLDRRTPEALLYARYSYMRFMTLQKVGAMTAMRRLLGLGLLAGVSFKLLSLALVGWAA